MFLLDLIYRIFLELIVSILLLRLKSDCEVICLQGSLANNKVKFLISDIDFLIVTEKKKLIYNFIQKMNKIPFIHIDADIYNKEEIKYLANFGSLKFYRFNYRFLKGNFEKSYFFYPLKFHINVLHSIFEKVEWINKIENKKTFFKRLKIERLVSKINEDLSLLNCNSIRFTRDYNSLINQLTSLLENSQGIKKISQIKISIVENFIKRDNDLSFDGINWIAINQDFKKGNYLNLTGFLFELFKNAGCFSLDYLFRFDLNSRNRLGAKFLELAGYGYFITGKRSWVVEVERSQTKENLFEDEYFQNINQLINNNFPQIDDCLSVLNRNIYINVFWGNDSRRQEVFRRASEKVKSQNGDFLHFVLNLSFHDKPEFKIEGNFLKLTIRGNPNNFDLWHKEALFNIAGFFLWGADTLIFADSDIYSHDQNWLNKLIIKTSEYDFVQGFSKVVDTIDEGYNAESWVKKYLEGESYFRAPGLIWAMKSTVFNKINGLPDDFPEGSGDGALVRELTGEKLSFIDYYPWFTNNLRNYVNQFTLSFVDVEVVHINHGRARDYVNRSIFLNLVNIDFQKVIDKDEFGLLSWKTNNYYLTAPFKLKDYIFEFSKDKFLFLIRELYEKGILKYLAEDRHIFFSKSPHYHELCLRSGGVGFIFDGIGDEIIFHLPEINKPNVIYDIVLSHIKILDQQSILKINLPSKNIFKAVEINLNGNKILAEFNMIEFEGKRIDKIIILLNDYQNDELMVVATGEAHTNQEWSTRTTASQVASEIGNLQASGKFKKGVNRIDINTKGFCTLKGALENIKLISFDRNIMYITLNKSSDSLAFIGEENYISCQHEMRYELYKSNNLTLDELAYD